LGFAYRCRRCKGPPVKAGPEGKPYIGPCPHCGGSYDAERVSVSEDEVPDAEVQPIVDGEAISMADAVAGVEADPNMKGIESGMKGLDWVLGGNIPIGIVILLASPSGAGKSTLIIELFRKLALQKIDSLYCSTEESTKQIGLRYRRLGKFPAKHFRIIHERDIAAIKDKLEKEQPRVAAVDSLNEVEGITDSNDFSISTGSPSAVKLAAKQLKDFASEQGITIFTVAQVTKGGDISGLNALIHTVDATLYFEGKREARNGRLVVVGPDRLLNTEGKNRFGSTDRRAHFQMLGDGLHDLGPWKHVREPWAKQAEDADESEGDDSEGSLNG
jgi:DNA repair protein RadA/Sms